MVRFEEKKLVIELEAHTAQNAIDKWMELINALYDLMGNLNDENISNTFYNIPEFLKELMPDWNVLLKMIPDENKNL